MNRLRSSAPAISLFIGGLALWEIVVRAFNIKGFILPAPSAIAAAFFDQADTLWPAGLATFASALAGLALGTAGGVAAAMAAARFSFVRDGAMPLAIAANSTPIIVLAPVANAWFGLTSPIGTVVVVAILVFFPIMINVVRGLLSARPSELELMSSYGAPRSTTLRKLRVPGSLPYLFSALKIASALALIGAIVKEYFGGPQNRLGQYITLKAGLLQLEEAWSAIVLASAFGICMYSAIVFVERRVIPWHVSVRSQS